MSTLGNASSVLKLFAKQNIMHSHPGISFSDVINQLCLAKSTTSRLLMAMESEGLLERDPDTKLYHIGRLLLSISIQYLSTPLVDMAASMMIRLSQMTRCTGYISALDGREIMVLRMFYGQQFLPVVTPVGTRSPANETAVGRAILSRQNDSEVRECFSGHYRAGSPNSPQSLDALLAALALARQSGWTFARNETLQGVSSIATSVTNKHCSETIGLCLSFSSRDEKPFYQDEHVEALISMTRLLAEKLDDDYWLGK
ncbi:IclR family transcriptional regulator [Yersinia ruckeri]|uniref:IclR family transcriptional regulator n=1 Tax=Yersinia ruckeri TaxID=29486 RepID=UPI0004E3DBB3|nr:IclR family transcriptional regulator C-terminal domain-containing protein [Yersinia ruckeri]AKA39434.1 IclR family transcriptional regulator [Yersinia ruckeri]ARZ02044.1 IclR family transcriptional regulator [Yersinia ruckeri]EKN4183279.1 helix-turn-helix domain-containing protein [Yersinia ruckeri]EKN4198700.1 helix-turn-helix domain-containing protein [Yersinia ruckeri]EKN4199912.1 helix-turn-helix domain-containing protein [Yersinia ruckeri]